jgi:arylsulfatase A
MKIKENIVKLSLVTTLLSMYPNWTYASELGNKTKPNIILLFADDMGWADISVQGARTSTPNLDHLAATGQRWTNFYVPSPVCSPSRGALMTGRLETRTGLYGTKSPVFVEEDPDGFPDNEVTIADSLRKNGYKTIIYGKWHLGAQSSGFPTRHGFDEWYGIPISNDRFNAVVDQIELDKLRMQQKNPTKAAALFKKIQQTNIHPKQEYWGVPLYHSYKVNGKYVDYVVPQGFKQADFTKDVTEKAKKYIAENKNTPFFMYMAYPQTHVPLFSSKEYEGKGHNRYGDIMLEIDWSVGEIYKSLEKNNIADNTVVIFTSDNGPMVALR